MRAALLALLAGFAASQSLRSPPTIGKATVVYVHMLVNALEKIDAVESSFTTDAYLSVAWVDRRLENATTLDFDDTQYWTPQVEFMNSKEVDARGTFYQWGLPVWLQDSVPLYNLDPSDVWVWTQSRYIGQFSAQLQLQEFPFDQQNATIQFESFCCNASVLTFRPAKDLAKIMVPPNVQVPGWTMDPEEHGVRQVYHYYPSWGESYSRMHLTVSLQRDGTYYVERVVTNIILLIAMGLCASALKADQPDRLGIMFAVFAAVVSWVFVLTSDTPRVAYLTRLDKFMNSSFYVIFALTIMHAGNYLYLALLEAEAEEEDEKENERKAAESAKLSASLLAESLGRPSAAAPSADAADAAHGHHRGHGDRHPHLRHKERTASVHPEGGAADSDAPRGGVCSPRSSPLFFLCRRGLGKDRRVDLLVTSLIAVGYAIGASLALYGPIDSSSDRCEYCTGS